MGMNFWRCEWALSSGCWVDVGYRRPCEGAGSGGYLCCLYRTGWLRALLCCWGCRRSQVWEAASLKQGRVWWGTAQGVLAGCAGEQWGNLGYQRCSTIMDGNHPEEGTHPPGKLKAAGLIEGFQVWCKVKWFTIREISFPVCCGFLFLVFFFPLLVIHVAHLAACPKEFVFLTRLAARAPPQPRQIPSNSWITPLTSKKFSWFCSALDQSKGSYCKNSSYKLWILLSAHRVEFCCTLVGVFMFFPQLCKWITVCV